MQEAIFELQDSNRDVTSDKVIREPESDNIRSIFHVHKDDNYFKDVANDQRILDIVNHLLGSDVYIHQSRINYKPGFKGKEFDWHSDFETWHVEDGMPRMRAVSLSIALSDNYTFNGPLMLIPRSQNYYVSCVGETPDNNYKESLKNKKSVFRMKTVCAGSPKQEAAFPCQPGKQVRLHCLNATPCTDQRVTSRRIRATIYSWCIIVYRTVWPNHSPAVKTAGIYRSKGKRYSDNKLMK